MLTTYIWFSSLKSQKQPLLGVNPSNGFPQRAHDRGAAAERGRVKYRVDEDFAIKLTGKRKKNVNQYDLVKRSVLGTEKLQINNSQLQFHRLE